MTKTKGIPRKSIAFWHMTPIFTLPFFVAGLYRVYKVLAPFFGPGGTESAGIDWKSLLEGFVCFFIGAGILALVLWGRRWHLRQRALKLILLFIFAASVTGCATSGYLADRSRDAADMLTVTVGLGAGANVRAGPIQTGLFLGFDQAGLRGGRLQRCPQDPYAPMPYVSQLTTPISGFESFTTRPKHSPEPSRGKDYVADGILCVTYARNLPYYTQIEAAVGLIGTLRLGCNPGELLDFILGWFTIDVYNDDLGGRKKRENTEQPDEPSRAQEVRLAKFGHVPLHFDLKENALPPGWEQAFVVPTGDGDQHGNPVVTRKGSRTDLRTGMPYEVWLRDPRMEFVLVPAGEFMMGYSSAAHQVRLTKPFYLAKYELTQAQYEAVIGSNPSRFKGARNPVEHVSWDDAVKFCEGVSAQAGGTFGLPTEGQWEYACRAGSQTAYCFGDNAKAGGLLGTDAKDVLGAHAWYDRNSEDKTHPVGQKTPNGWGLYDLHGNVWEWCADRSGDYPSGSVTDPTGPTSGLLRVLRGGSFHLDARSCHSAYRPGGAPCLRNSGIGFRPSRSLP